MKKPYDTSNNNIWPGYWGTPEQIEKISNVLSDMTDGKYHASVLSGHDLGNPYSFDTKGEWNKAQKTLEKAVRQIGELLVTFKELSDLGISEEIDMDIRFERKGMKASRVYATDLVIDNGIRLGTTRISSEFLLTLSVQFSKYLEDVKKTGWPEGITKARQYSIARKIAEIYVQYNGESPTFGTNNGVASTSYGKAVEGIFKILGVKGNANGAARKVAQGLTHEMIEEIKKKNASPRYWFSLGRRN